MIILLDTSTPVCRLTLVEDETQTDIEWQADRELANGLLAFLKTSFVEHGKDWSDIEAIGVFEGPGSFTGLRIGLTVMNTIADSEQLPIVGAQGDDWKTIALKRLSNDENDRIVMPFYGSDPHITAPRK